MPCVFPTIAVTACALSSLQEFGGGIVADRSAIRSKLIAERSATIGFGDPNPYMWQRTNRTAPLSLAIQARRQSGDVRLSTALKQLRGCLRRSSGNDRVLHASNCANTFNLRQSPWRHARGASMTRVCRIVPWFAAALMLLGSIVGCDDSNLGRVTGTV